MKIGGDVIALIVLEILKTISSSNTPGSAISNAQLKMPTLGDVWDKVIERLKANGIEIINQTPD